MAIAIALPILSFLVVLQSAVFSRIVLLKGTADLILIALIAWAVQKRVRTAWYWCIIGGLFVSFVSALPLGAPLIGYVIAVSFAIILRQQVWQVPILAMFIATIMGTFIVQIVDYVALTISGINIPFWQSINLIILPSIILNIILAIPFYAIFNDLSKWLYPEEIVV